MLKGTTGARGNNEEGFVNNEGCNETRSPSLFQGDRIQGIGSDPVGADSESQWRRFETRRRMFEEEEEEEEKEEECSVVASPSDADDDEDEGG